MKRKFNLKAFAKALFLATAISFVGNNNIPAHAGSYGVVGLKPTSKATYAASTAIFTPAASATDIWQIYGSSSKTVKILKIYLMGGKATSGATLTDFYLLKRSTANSSGTAVTATNIPLDSANSAATAVVKHYTANPTTGTLVGQVFEATQLNTASTSFNSCLVHGADIPFFDADKFGQPIVLRGTGEGVVINLNGSTIGNAATVSVTVVWTEE